MGTSTKMRARQSSRVLFLGRKLTVTEGRTREAKAALDRARSTQNKWKPSEWEDKMNNVLAKYRKGIQWGGCRLVVASKKNSSAVGDKQRGASSSAVGDTQKRANPQRVTGNNDHHEQDTGAPDSTAIRSVVLSPREAAIGAHGDVIGLQNKLRIQHPCTLVGGGAFGEVYRMSAVPAAALRSPSTA